MCKWYHGILIQVKRAISHNSMTHMWYTSMIVAIFLLESTPCRNVTSWWSTNRNLLEISGVENPNGRNTIVLATLKKNSHQITISCSNKPFVSKFYKTLNSLLISYYAVLRSEWTSNLQSFVSVTRMASKWTKRVRTRQSELSYSEREDLEAQTIAETQGPDHEASDFKGEFIGNPEQTLTVTKELEFVKTIFTKNLYRLVKKFKKNFHNFYPSLNPGLNFL